jgi:predicted nucleic acid-binding protein
MTPQSEAVYILDTNILNILFYYPGPKRDAVLREIRRVGKEDVCVSAISVYELVGVGAVPEINTHINSPRAPEKLTKLTTLVYKLSQFHILLFTDDAHRIFDGLPAATKRRGPMDARIAASALTDTSHTVVTEDDEVFELAGVPNVNWARPTL